MPVDLAPNALASLEDVRLFMKSLSGDLGADDFFVTSINQASAMIQRYCSREFTPTLDAERIYSYDGFGYLNLSPFDLASVTSIALDLDADAPTVLEPASYRLTPRPSIDGVYTAVHLPLRFGYSDVAIVGDWGFPAVPADIANACILTVVSWYRGGYGGVPDQFEDSSSRVSASFPSGVVPTLDRYRRP